MTTPQLEDVQETTDALDAPAASTDLVRAYLKEIGKVPLLTAVQEVELSQRIEAGLFATYKLRQPRLSASRAASSILGIACAPSLRSMGMVLIDCAACPKNGISISSFLAM